MHMADALVSPTVGATMYVASSCACIYSLKKVRQEDDPKKIPMMGVMGALVFATQMLNFTIPGTGSSGHLCGGMMLSAILGPSGGFLTMIGVLTIQCLLFGDGGILSLGANIWNMAFYGCFIGSLIWKFILKDGVNKKKIFIASILGCVITLQLGAFSVTLETLLSKVSELPFSYFVSLMQPIHLAIGLIEGLITGTVLSFIYESRPEVLYGVDTQNKGKLSFKNTIIILSITALLFAGGVSLFASAYPDGLEWSIENITGSTEIEASGDIYEKVSSIQETTSILPDYNFKDSESNEGTSFSGIVGVIVVAVLCVGASKIFRFYNR